MQELLQLDPLEVCPRLLGAVLRVASDEGEVALRITEVEAYRGEDDPGSHAYRGRTKRNATMFAAAGAVYVYLTYGMHHCVNLVCGPEGLSRAVLLRAGEVVEGVELARRRRPAARKDAQLASGPGRLCQALALDRADDGAVLGAVGGRLRLALPEEPVPAGRIRTGPRTGVSGPGGEGSGFPWRFWIDGDPTVSPYKAAVAKSRKPRRQ
ncbi:3-methyladenine DNA glycosylase [Actinomyces bovis]|uniref:Putative 3-methyladenine DNA glycosylase n=2 Tax=Actinomyces bovis TaxID=1658 RepID=A0ABY1VQF2_9ACTO|nr:3-methyladenine DNA glycosylase [Actinomyces bovis]VEG53524.1 3-methyladenine DNA glycosylase [Actinomyces israelii]